jgi:glycosyltransferase involved in cell wall biosynthesis
MPSERKSRKKRIYFLVPAPLDISPGQRFRFEHYLSYLEQNGLEYKISSFYSLAGWKGLFVKGGYFRKIFAVITGFLKRLLDLFRLWKYDFVFIYREAVPLGPPFIEWVIGRVYKKKIIYDFDDAIWVPVSSQFNRIALSVKWFSKIAVICRWSYKVSVGNEYLKQFAAKYNRNVEIIPTVVNTREIHNSIQVHSNNSPAIGWTGTFSTLKYLDMVLPVLQELQAKHDFTFIVIANLDPKLPLSKYKFIPWSRETEAQDLLSFQIGLMPLFDDEISRGKCGFKAIQYMAMGIPAVVSPVGVNMEIVDNGENGFICDQPQEWKSALEELLANPSLRNQMGKAARKKIETHYSVDATLKAFINLFN